MIHVPYKKWVICIKYLHILTIMGQYKTYLGQFDPRQGQKNALKYTKSQCIVDNHGNIYSLQKLGTSCRDI